MMRHLWIALALALAAAACGDRASTQEAYDICEDIGERIGTLDDDSFAACVACHETCGGECNTTDGSFTCPE